MTTTDLIIKRLPRIALCILASYAVLLAGQQAYYRFMPANYFLNYYKAEAHNVEVGENGHMTLCRSKHYSNFKLEATRTFLKQDPQKNNDFVPAYEYRFEPIIENGAECQDIVIPPTRQPQEPGTYYIHTEADFYVNGYRKTISYDSTRYKVIENDRSIQQRIDDLQRQIDTLRAMLTPTASAPSQTTPAIASSNSRTLSGGQSSTNNSSTNTPSQSNNTQTSSATIPPPDNEGVIVDLPLLPVIKIPSPF